MTALLVLAAILVAESVVGLDSRFVHAILAVGLGLAVAMLVASLRDLRAAESRTDAALARAIAAETGQRARGDQLAHLLAEVQRTQQELVQASKLGAVGELAAAVAHEVNNPLTGILGFADLLLTELPEDDARHGEVLVIRDEAMRARSIVKALLEFARPRPPQRVSTDLSALARSTVELVRFRTQAAGILVVEDYADLPWLEVDPDSLKQVLLNLINNAIEAMPQGGELGISTGSGEGLIRLAIRDSGLGIDAATRARIFTPFFSTRSASGGGTGLGLSVSVQIVESHGGSIEVESEPGRGSVFTVWLPAAPPAAQGATIVRDGESRRAGALQVRPAAGETNPRVAARKPRDAGREAAA